MFFAAANALAREVSSDDLALGRVFPSLDRIRDVSTSIAAAVAEVAYERGLAQAPRPENLEEYIRSHMFEPNYTSFV
jgi:malate dehydrogenase (oxaloacetate-decarboxylating)(NADP+)